MDCGAPSEHKGAVEGLGRECGSLELVNAALSSLPPLLTLLMIREAHLHLLFPSSPQRPFGGREWAFD